MKEALRMALEALTIARGQLKSWGLGDEAITAIKEALAQPEQSIVSYERFMSVEKELADMTAEFMRVAKQLAQPEQGPVAHCEAGPEYCWKCNEEMKATYGSEEIRKLREVNKRLSDHILDAKKMVAQPASPPPECQTEAEKTAYAFGWWKALESVRQQPAPVQQEPVLWMMPDGNTADKWALQFYGGQKGKPLYTTPPQRTWVGLTADETKNFVQAVWPREATPTDCIRAIEAKLKEKNT